MSQYTAVDVCIRRGIRRARFRSSLRERDYRRKEKERSACVYNIG